MNFTDVKKILVIKLRHIGDVLLTVPAFRALRENFPDAQISALVNSGTEEVLSGNPLINEIIVFDRKVKKMNSAQKYLRELSFLKMIRAKHFDMTADLTSGDRAAILSFTSGARYRLAYDPGSDGFWGKRHLYTHLSKKDGSRHMVFQNLDVLRQFGIKTDNLTVDVFVPDEAKTHVKHILAENGIGGNDRIVHVHPTSRWLFKCWKDEHMARVIGWLLNHGINVVVTSSPDRKEMDKTKKILSLIPKPQSPNPVLIDLCGKTTIKQLAAISAASEIFLGVDSAPMHIAAAVGTPVIALFGPTGERQWGPWGKGHRVFSLDMDCKPCQKGVCDNFELRKCLEAITPDEIMNALSSSLGLKKPSGVRSGNP